MAGVLLIWDTFGDSGGSLKKGIGTIKVRAERGTHYRSY